VLAVQPRPRLDVTFLKACVNRFGRSAARLVEAYQVVVTALMCQGIDRLINGLDAPIPLVMKTVSLRHSVSGIT